ncbi:hypothetical protein ACF0H5_004137 [Mactra antiquata]
MGILRRVFGKDYPWKFEVFKMGLYIYIPIFVWYGYNCDFVQRHYVLPYYKKYNPNLYKKLTLGFDDDDKSSS